jgi:hypothetical protein
VTRGVWATIAMLAVAASSLAAQTGSPNQGTLPSAEPAWATAWSPVLPLADLARGLPHAPALPLLLAAPAPRVGLLWTAGTPANLGRDVNDLRTRLSLAGSGENGDYRRPLDPVGSRAIRFEGAGWGPLGTRGAVIGRVSAGRLDDDPSSPSVAAGPYGSSPFVLTDTTSPGLRRVVAQLEGGIGGRFGAWGAGLTVGVLVNRDNSQDARFSRLDQRSVPGVTAGVSRTVPLLGIRLAAFGRWTGNAETVILPGTPAPGLVYLLDGYTDPDPLAVSLNTPFVYRTDRSTWAGGLAAAGTLGRATWTVFGERATRTDKQVTDIGYQVPTDYWRADAWTWAGAIQRPAFGDHVLATVWAGYSTLTGSATRADLPGDIFRASENAFAARADVRYASRDSTWQFATVLSLAREHRIRQDFITVIASDVVSLTPGAGVELAYRFGGTALALGYGLGGYSASASIPDPASMGDVYRALTAPELELYAHRAVPMAATFTLRQRTSARTALLLFARGGRLAPSGDAPGLTLVPTGDRLALDVSVGVVIGR